ncbi:MAG: hypothetical protein SOW10_04170, partial [Alloprevotella sp.]|nr:hypothetical protein [Alloprevotella sp.]
MLTAKPYLRRTVVAALADISDNMLFSEEWNLRRLLCDAVRLCYDARKAGYKFGEAVSIFARQGELFA